MVLDSEELVKYRKHPRVLEVRFLLFYNMLEKEFGYDQTIRLIQSICSSFNCNMVFLQGIINKRFDIQKSRREFTMWRQEVVFTCTCYGESTYKIAQDHFNINPSSLYQQPKYNINNFCNNEWLEKLDNRVTLCGQASYRLEVIRFFEVVDMLMTILEKWRGGKK